MSVYVTDPPAPSVTGTLRSEDQAWLQANGLADTLDPHRLQHRSELIRVACDIAAVAKRYRKIHHALFGFSVRKIFYAVQPDKLMDLAALEIELDLVDTESRRIQQTIGDTGFNDIPKRAKTIIATRDALVAYIEALIDTSQKLSLICRNIRREREGETAFAHYSANQLQRDKAVYDASVQEFRRWGTRLKELFDKF